MGVQNFKQGMFIFVLNEVLKGALPYNKAIKILLYSLGNVTDFSVKSWSCN